MKKILSLFGVLTFMLTSCSSDDSSSDSNIETATIKPTKIIHLTPENSVIYVTDIKYDGNKIVSSTDDDGYVLKYTYTGDLITKIEQFRSFTALEKTTEYTYLNGKLSTEIERKPNQIKYFETKYTYNPDGTVSYNGKQINSAPGESVTSSGRNTYKDGNLIKNETIYNGEVAHSVSFEYDTKKNPMRNVLAKSSPFNNEVKMISSDSPILGSTVTYTYNNNDFPTESKRFGSKGELDEIVQYIY